MAHKNDIILNIGSATGKFDIKEEKLTYNLSKFFRNYQTFSLQWQEKLKTFVTKLDNKVQIDITEERHKPVLDGLDNFMAKLCQELAKTDKCFENVKIRKTGSIYAGTQTGKSYEADLLLEKDENDEETTRHFVRPCDLESYILSIQHNLLIINWTLHAAESHNLGVCLFLEYKPDGCTKGTGFKVDLIPVIKLKDPFDTKELSENSQRYLREMCGDISLVQHKSAKFDKDTAYIHHQLIKYLPEKVKTGYRVAQYLIQSIGLPGVNGCRLPEPVKEKYKRALNFLKSNKYKQIDKAGQFKVQSYISEASDMLGLYGYSPFVRSDVLHALLFQIMIRTHGTVLQGRLDGARLAFCLIDMIYHIAQAATNVSVAIHHPLIWAQGQQMSFVNRQFEYSREKRNMLLAALQNMICAFLRDATEQENALDHYQLLNSPLEDNFDFVHETLKSKAFRESEKLTKEQIKELIIKTGGCPCKIAVYKREDKPPKLNFMGFCEGSDLSRFAEASGHIQFDITDQYVHTFIDGRLVWCHGNPSAIEDTVNIKDRCSVRRILGDSDEMKQRIRNLAGLLEDITFTDNSA